MSRPSIVFFLSSEWSRYHRPGLIRAVAAALKGTSPVLVVNNPVCWITSRWHRPVRWRQWRRHRNPAARLQQVGDNLMLLDTLIPLHDKLIAARLITGMLNRQWLARQTRAAAHRIGMCAPLVSWFQFPTFSHYAGMLGEALSLYECYDEHTDVPGLSSRVRRCIGKLERQLMQRCGLVFTTSKPLHESRCALHRNVVLTYNAADPVFFAPVAANSLQRADRHGDRSLTVGYLGTLHEHTDLALLAGMAERRPDWRFVLIGPVQSGADRIALGRLRAAANVHMHGWVEESQLIALLCSFDVGVIPYRSDARFNRFVNPNKLHEFTAMGLPVVLSPGVDVSSHEGRVRIADGVDAFISAVASEHAEDSPERVERRLQFAQTNSWNARATLMLGHIERTLDERAAGRGG